MLELLARGAPTGLRIDHVDGLFAPGDYLRRLQARAADVGGAAADASGRAVYLVVEKILGSDEQLPADWPVHGTTGYEFAGVVNNLFVDGRHERAMDDIYQRFLRAPRSQPSFDDLAYQSRKQVVHETMSGDINSLGHQLNRLVGAEPALPRLHAVQPDLDAIKEVIACFPVYRTYITAEDDPQRPRSPLHHTGRAVRQPAIAGLVVAGVRLHRARAAQAGAGRQPGRARGARAVHREVPADHQPGRRQGHRRHGVLRLQPAGLAERSGRQPDAVRAQPERRARLDVRTAAALACGAVGHVDARHQARRGRARATERPLGTARGVERRRHEVARAQSPLPGRHRRR